MERIEITITGELPEDTKYAVLAAARQQANLMAVEMSQAHKLSLSVSVKSIRPSAKKAAPLASPVRAIAAE